MKKVLFLMLGLISLPAFAQDLTEKVVKTEVSEVTVYLSKALETRFATVDVLAGKTQLNFVGLTTQMDEQSIQAKVEGDVTLMGVNSTINYLNKTEDSPEKLALKEKLEVVEKKIKTELTLMEVIDEDLEYLKANRNIGGNQAVTLVSIREGAVFFNEKVTALKMQKMDRAKTLESLNRQRTDLLAQLNGIRSNPSTGEVLVLIDAEKATRVKIALSYLVLNSGWSPSYDIRAKTLKDPLEIVYKANVWQNTQSDWKNVRLKLSTNNPSVSGIAPQLDTYFLDFAYIRPLVKTSQLALNEVDIVELADQVAPRQLKSEGAKAKTLDIQQTSNPISIEFDVKVPYSVKSDSKPVSIEMSRLNMSATFQYFSIPKLSSDVFLTAKIQDWEKYNFLMGPANVYLEGAFVCQTDLNVLEASDTLSISMGIDKSIHVQREMMKDYEAKQTLSSKKTATRAWKTTVRNTRAESINLLLVDQVPVSSNSEIEITHDATSGASFNAETGEVRWEKVINPGQNTLFNLKYSVKFPKNKVLELE
jgi:uncharacterized protein (TIGR02231 family)